MKEFADCPPSRIVAPSHWLRFRRQKISEIHVDISITHFSQLSFFRNISKRRYYVNIIFAVANNHTHFNIKFYNIRVLISNINAVYQDQQTSWRYIYHPSRKLETDYDQVISWLKLKSIITIICLSCLYISPHVPTVNTLFKN